MDEVGSLNLSLDNFKNEVLDFLLSFAINNFPFWCNFLPPEASAGPF